MFDYHMASNMFLFVVKYLDAMCLQWHSKLISLALDGANVMTGHHSGVVIQIEKKVEFEVH
jgi:hypothetical protein